MKPNLSLVDTVAGFQTLSAKNAQDAWTDFVILRLRQKQSPGCHMRDFCAWWDKNRTTGERNEDHLQSLSGKFW